MQTLARRLEEAVEAGQAEEAHLSLVQLERGGMASPRSPEAGSERQQQQLAAAAALPAKQQEEGAELLARAGNRAAEQQPASVQQQQATAEEEQAATGAWQALLVPLAAVARVDVRPRAADAAAAVLFSTCKAHCGGLSPSQWLRLCQAVLLPLLALPADDESAQEGGLAARLDSAHMLGPHSSLPAAAAGPSGMAVGSNSREAVDRRSTSASGTGGGPGSDGLPTAVPSALSFEGLDRYCPVAPCMAACLLTWGWLISGAVAMHSVQERLID